MQYITLYESNGLEAIDMVSGNTPIKYILDDSKSVIDDMVKMYEGMYKNITYKLKLSDTRADVANVLQHNQQDIMERYNELKYEHGESAQSDYFENLIQH